MRSQSRFFKIFGGVFLFFGVFADIAGGAFIVAGEWLVGLLVLTIFGGAFTGVGVWIFLKGVRIARTQARLLAQGHPVVGVVERVAQDTSVAINEEHPWVLTCAWTHPSSGERKSGKSDFFWEDPSGRFPRGAQVTVLVDDQDPALFWIDVSENGSGSRAA
jgi:hypothetical protein